MNVTVNVDYDRCVANDNLGYLIEIYGYIRDTEIASLLRQIEDVIEMYGLSDTNQTGYNALRSSYNESKNPLKLLVLCFYSFNHQLRFNNSHEFNCSFGRNRSRFNDSIKNNLISFSKALKSRDILFLSDDFRETGLVFGSGDFIYADPPYIASTAVYNDGNRGFTMWGAQEEADLRALLDEANEAGALFALSNVLDNNKRDNQGLASWAVKHGYKVHHLDHSYANSSYHRSNRDGGDEVLITNYN